MFPIRGPGCMDGLEWEAVAAEIEQDTTAEGVLRVIEQREARSPNVCL
jgi:hypothetical protein